MITNSHATAKGDAPKKKQRHSKPNGPERDTRRERVPTDDATTTSRQAVRQRQLDALRDRAALHGYPTANAAHAPAIDAEERARTRQSRLEMTDQQVLVEGLHAGRGALIVNRWTGTPVAGWTLEWYDLELRADGFPFGALIYRNNDHSDAAVRVGVQWDHDAEQLTSIALDETEDRRADNAEHDVLRDLERDARGRLGALLGSYATIGSYVASRAAEDALLDAAGLSGDVE